MQPLIKFLGILFLVSATLNVYAEQQQNHQAKKVNSIRFGVLPYLSTKTLIEKWQPFATELEKKIARKIILKTAPDYSKYITRTANYKYDFLITAPHFAVLAQQESGYQIIAGFSNRLSGDFTVLENSPYHTLQDLRAKTITTPDPLAVVTILGELALQKVGVNPIQEVTMKHTPSHNNAILYVINHISDASISVGGLYKRFNKENKTKLRLLAKTQEIPHVMIIANPKVDKKVVDQVRQEILNNKSNTIQDSIKNIGWGKLQTVSNSDILELQTLLPLLKDRMKK